MNKIIKFAALLRNVTFSLIAVLLLVSCKDSYNYVVRKGTTAKKLEYATKYFKKKKYNKAQPLLEEIYPKFKGKKEAEEVYYMLAFSHYKLKDFLLASYHFQNFAQLYTLSPRVEECSYLHCICEYNKSLPAYLDQSITLNGIKSFQIFINNFPDSKYIGECNNYIDKLRSKLHKKAYENAILYYETGNYKAAGVAFQNAINDYPDLPEKDLFEFLILKANYQYAKNSVIHLRPERLQKTLDLITEYYAEHQQSTNEYFAQAKALEATVGKELETVQSELLNKPYLIPKTTNNN